MRTKSLLYCFSVVILCSFFSCTSDEGSDLPPEKAAPHLNISDSLAVVDIWKKADGVNWIIKWDLNNLQTWGGTTWVLNLANNEYRIVELNINVPVNERVQGYISPKVGELTELRYFNVGGTGITGDIPESLANLPHLSEINIQKTSVGGTIPPKLFLLPEIRWFNISANPNIRGEIPQEITQMNPEVITCRLSENSLSGKIPSGMKIRLLELRGNKYTEYPFEYCQEGTTNVILDNNCLSGLIPDSILQDEKALNKLYYTTFDQKPGYGFSNTPESWGK